MLILNDALFAYFMQFDRLSIAKIPSALKPLTLASPAGRLPNHDGRTDFVVFVSEIRA
jgi:hypothetical protein